MKSLIIFLSLILSAPAFAKTQIFSQIQRDGSLSITMVDHKGEQPYEAGNLWVVIKGADPV